MTSRRFSLLLVLVFCGPVLAGDLEPPGPPAPTMKTLSALEPRTAVQELPLRDPGVRVIDRPGSYYLAGNLVGGGGITAISIEAADVVLDLNGFALIGTTDSDSAINVMPPAKNVVIRNGTIRDWPVNGIFAANCQVCEVEDLLVENCGARVSTAALWLGPQGVVRRVTVRGNPSGPGILTEFEGRIEHSISVGNQIGFYLAGDTGSVIESIAASNDQGFHLQAASVARRCVSAANGHGFEVVDGGRVTQSEIVGNTNGVVVWGNGAQLEGNLLAQNAGTSILIGGSAQQVRVAANTIRCGDGGTGVSTNGSVGQLIVGNTFRACATPLAVDGANAVGELLDFRGGGTITSANPYANLLF